MLVLSRKLNETIVIGNNIRIKVAAISGGQVRLGIEAPSEIRVMREELLFEEEAPVLAKSASRAISASRPPLATSNNG